MREVITRCHWCGFPLEDWEREYDALHHNYNYIYCSSCPGLPEFQDFDDFEDYDREMDMVD